MEKDQIDRQTMHIMGAQWPQGWRNLVYVRPVKLGDLPDELAQQVDGPKDEILYAIHNAEGAPLAIVDSHAAAIYGAKQHQLLPQSVH